MQVPAEVDDLQLYTKEALAKRLDVSVRTIENYAKDPACPLKWTHGAGKKKACDGPTLRKLIDWLRLS